MKQDTDTPRAGMTAEQVRALMGEPALKLGGGDEENWIYQTAEREVRVRFILCAREVFTSEESAKEEKN